MQTSSKMEYSLRVYLKSYSGRQCVAGPSLRGLHLVEFSKDFSKGDPNGRSGNGKLTRQQFIVAMFRGNVGSPADRIDEPNVFDAHGEKVVDAIADPGFGPSDHILGALSYYSVDVVAVGPIGGEEVFAERDLGGARHMWIIAQIVVRSPICLYSTVPIVQ